ncbi:hypothetical protein DIURU_000132 [Diutina rugosa]|uniref:Uncharacterized protein n=1 Tax=Diutina rugosa TaxID=5481 RepID=A0A642UZQ4_DIURU|nr:uncharacterized protein DIURU_000132 [Diutina rugosa]KAA8908589.1 hypothetical protein DIURU_000132 [Diutina rugosa]
MPPRSPRSASPERPERRARSPIKATGTASSGPGSASSAASVSSDGSRASSARWQEWSSSPMASKLHILPSSSRPHTIPIPFQIMMPPKLSPSPQVSPQQSPEMASSDVSMASMGSSSSSMSNPGRLVYTGLGYERVDDDLDGDPFFLPPAANKGGKRVPDQLSIIEESSETSSRASSVRRRLASVRRPSRDLAKEMPSQILEDDDEGDEGDDSVIINKNKRLPELPRPSQSAPTPTKAPVTMAPSAIGADTSAASLTTPVATPPRQAKSTKSPSFFSSWQSKFAWNQPWDAPQSTPTSSPPQTKTRPKSMAIDTKWDASPLSVKTKRYSMPPVATAAPTTPTKPRPVRTGIKVMAPMAAPTAKKPPVLARSGSQTSRSTVSTPSQAPTTFTLTTSPGKGLRSPPATQERCIAIERPSAPAPAPPVTDRVASDNSTSSTSSWDSLQQSVDISLADKPSRQPRHSSAEWVTEEDEGEEEEEEDEEEEETATFGAASPRQGGRNFSNFGSSALVQMAPQAFLRSPSHDNSHYFEDSVIGAYMDVSGVNTTVNQTLDAIEDNSDSVDNVSDEGEEATQESFNDSGNDGMGKRFSFPNDATNITNEAEFKQHPVHQQQQPRGYTTPSGQIEIPDLNQVAASAYSSSAPRSSLVLFDDVASRASTASTEQTALEPLGEPTQAAQKVINDHFEAMHSDSDSNTEISSTTFSMFNRSKLAPPKDVEDQKEGKARAPSPSRHQRHRSHHQIDVADLVAPQTAHSARRRRQSFTVVDAREPTTPTTPNHHHSRKSTRKSVKILSPPPPSDTSAASAVSATPEEMSIVVSPPPAPVEYAVDFVESSANDDSLTAGYCANAQSEAKHSIYARRYPHQRRRELTESSPTPASPGSPITPPDQVVPAPLSASSMSMSSYHHSGSESAHTRSTAPSEVMVDGYHITAYKSPSPPVTTGAGTVANDGINTDDILISVHEDIGGQPTEVVLVADDDDDSDELLSIYSKYRRNYLFRNSSTASRASGVSTATSATHNQVKEVGKLGVPSSAFVEGLKVVSAAPMETIAEKVSRRVHQQRAPVGVDGSPPLTGIAATSHQWSPRAKAWRVGRNHSQETSSTNSRSTSRELHQRSPNTERVSPVTKCTSPPPMVKAVSPPIEGSSSATKRAMPPFKGHSPSPVTRGTSPSPVANHTHSRSSMSPPPTLAPASPSRIPKSPRMANIRGVVTPPPKAAHFRHSWAPQSSKKQLKIPPTMGSGSPIDRTQAKSPSPSQSSVGASGSPTPTKPQMQPETRRPRPKSVGDPLFAPKEASKESPSDRRQARRSMYDVGKSYASSRGANGDAGDASNTSVSETTERGHTRGKSLGSQYYDYTTGSYDFNSFMQSRTTPAF